MANIVITVTTPDGKLIGLPQTVILDGHPLADVTRIASYLAEQAYTEEQDYNDLHCTCDVKSDGRRGIAECPSCGISRAHARQSDYWQRVGRD